MLDKKERSIFRDNIFRHLDGIATSTTAYTLHKNGLLDFLLENDQLTLNEIADKFNANEGYLNVALRILCSQGWLSQSIDNASDIITYKINENSAKAFELVHLYEDPVHLLSYSVKFPEERIGPDAFLALERIFKKYENHFGLKNDDENSIEFQILKHIEGVIAGPLIVMLGVNGLFHKYFMEASFRAQEYHKNPESFKKILDFLTGLGLFKKKKEDRKSVV